MFKNLFLIAYLDIKESFRAKWFYIYSVIFGGLMALFFISGVTQSVVMGFSGLSRLLLIYIQVCIIILPIFILISTTKSILSDKESNILEYMLSFPISLKEYYWGKILGRFISVFLPIILAMVLAVILGFFQSAKIPWDIFLLYSLMLFSLTFVFLGFAFFISALVKTQDIALGICFFLWIFLLGFLDIALISLMIKSNINEEIIMGIALINPLEVFRIQAIALFDPELTVMGVTAYFILDTFGKIPYMIFGILYPLALGCVFSYLGFVVFGKKDLL